MRRRRFIWILLGLLCVTGVWLFWRQGRRSFSPKSPAGPAAVARRAAPVAPAKVARRGTLRTNPARISMAEWNTNRFAGRLRNTAKPIGQLVNDNHAILLANALIETTKPLHFDFPKNLQPQGDPGAYIVQAHGPITPPFRALLAQAGARIVSYIPNDAYLVRAAANVAGRLEGNPLVQAVIPYEPYYKIQSSLLLQAVHQMQLPDKAALNLALFAQDAKTTIAEIKKLGGRIVAQTQSPFGPEVRVIPPRDWTALTTLPGVQIVEPSYQRAAANDLSRATVGVAADSLTTSNYLGLSGANILVAVDDTGIDVKHPDLQGRVIEGDGPTDTEGHGTEVAGIIAGDGSMSGSVTNAPGSILPGGTGTNEQFRGMAPAADLYSLNFDDPDQYLQEAAADTNALISNNSWTYVGAATYDLAAASYDAAVRDALPTVSGSQPVLFVFAAGNDGNGDDSSDPGGGTPDSIESPATAKNVITVGAIQEARNITASVTNVTVNSDGTLTTNVSQPWAAETSTSYRVAGFSGRGNVGIGLEGKYGRFKPDVCAPGTFIISTRSEDWDMASYFYQNPTNHDIQTYTGQTLDPGALWGNVFPIVPPNATQVTINVYPNADSPVPFPELPIYFGLASDSTYTHLTRNNQVSIPSDGGLTIADLLNSQTFYGFMYAVSNDTANPLSFDLQTDIISTNGYNNYNLVLSNLNQSIGTFNAGNTQPGPYYRYDSGTSMAAADVSGVLALMQQFYTNAYGTNPSPAMLKAMLINGAQATGLYDYQVQNAINFEGWGLVNLPDSLPLGLTNKLGALCSAYIQDQSPANALATGDRQTLYVVSTNDSPLRVTLAWTDPPGDPAAAIKLVNNLVLVVTNLDDPTNPIVYYGNDIGAGSTYNTPETPGTNTPPKFDFINNVQNVYLPSGLGTNSVTVLGYRVNVNALTAQTNNVVQDYALVISSQSTNAAMTVSATPSPGPAPAPIISNPTGGQRITDVSQIAAGNQTSFQMLLNQFAGASSPLLGTNTVAFSSSAPEGFGPNNWQVTAGQTNQWHFYVVSNTFDYSNAAFVVFNPNAPQPDTLSVPRMGVFTSPVGNATRQADVDLYVSTDPGLTNLDPNVISNAVVGTQVGAAAGPTFAGASLGRGSTEFVVDTNARSRTPQVYYVGVKSEDQMSAEYGFISIFSNNPFSRLLSNGSQQVYGVPVPMNIPDGSPTLPGKGYVFGLAIYPMTIGTVTVSNVITHQNFGDLIGTLTLNGGHADVLNNHDSFGNPPGPYYLSYDDSRGGGIFGSRPSDGPGSLNSYIGQQALGVWMLTEVDDSLTQTGRVDNSTLTIQPHRGLGLGVTNTVPAHGWVYGYIDAPPGATNLTFFGTNVSVNVGPQPLEMYVKYGLEPTTNDYDYSALLNLTGGPAGPGNSISIPPPLASGRYFVGVYNPNNIDQAVYLLAKLGLAPVNQAIFNSADTPIPIPDDAVTSDTIYVPANQTIYSLEVGLAVQHPRISDLVFHLISPDGTRVLLMQNRGGTSTNGAGGIATVTTNTLLNSTFEGAAQDYTVNEPVGASGWTVGNNQVSVETDPANTPPGSGLSNYLTLANGMIYANLTTTPGATYTVTFRYRGPGIVGWWRGEGNYIDSSGYGNNPSAAPSVTFTNGYVGQAFNFNGTSSSMTMPASSSLAVSNLTFEAWIFPTTSQYEPIIDYGAAGQYSAAHFWINGYGLTANRGAIYANLRTNNNAAIWSPGGIVNQGAWNHVTFTYNLATGLELLYHDAVPVATNVVQPVDLPPTAGEPVNIGTRNPNSLDVYGGYPYLFGGAMDEVSIYNRALTASEIKAIYNDSTNGKFNSNEFLLSPPDSLAEAQININGATNNIFGDNNTWKTYTVSFTAKNTSTLLQIQGLEPGMLLDAASVTAVVTNYHYLVFTENTNQTTTPIKFAVPPFTPGASSTNVVTSGFDSATPGNYTTAFNDGTNVWNVMSNQVSVVNDPANAANGSSNFLALADGTIATTLPTVAGKTYVLTFHYRGPGIVSMWRGESNALDSADGNNGTWNGTTNYGPGEVDSAFSFNGSSDVGIPNASSLNPPGSFSIEGWIYPLADENAKIITKWGDEGSYSYERSYNLETDLGRDLGFSISDLANQGNTAFQAFVVTNVLTVGAWNHIAATYNSATGVRRLYVDGVVKGTHTNAPVSVYASITPVTIGAWLRSPTFTQDYFNGSIDELGFYGRCLSPSEVQAISAAGTNGDFNPSQAIPTALAEAQVSINGGSPATFFGENNNWQPKTITFTAKQNGTPLQITGLEPGMLLDSFTLAESSEESYYLPEEPMDTFDGQNAQGPWTLEIQDDRAGATNPPPQLLSWQLRFTFATLGTNVAGLPPGTVTNVIPANSWAYYKIDVPTNADQATNRLVFATGPLNIWFNPANDPIGATPPDHLLLGGATNGMSVLTTFSTPTNIVPGGVYYIGLQNTNSYQVTNGFEVDFHYFSITPVPPGVPITNVVTGAVQGDGVNYYSFAVPTNADYATNRLLASTQPVNVWFNQTKAPVCLSPPDSLLISNATQGVFVLSGVSTPPLQPGLTYYVAIQNTNGPNATNVFEVDFHLTTTLTNGVPTTNSVPSNSFVYYSMTVPTNADYATNRLLFADLPVNVWFNQNVSPTGTNGGDYLLIGNATNGVAVLSAGSTPPLVPGATYYLGVQNTNNVAVNFGLEVNFHLVQSSGIASGPTITYTNIGGTNGILLTWYAQTNYQYQIQWTPSLAPPIGWITIPGVVVTYVPGTASNGIGKFQYFDDGALTGGFGMEKFYRLIAYPPGSTIPPALVISRVQALPGGGVQLQWKGLTNYQYDVQWTTNLALPAASWNVLSNLTSPTLTYTSGVFTFSDPTGTLTGGDAAAKFLRVLLLP